jgi:hypothetical protein
MIVGMMAIATMSAMLCRNDAQNVESWNSRS